MRVKIADDNDLEQVRREGERERVLCSVLLCCVVLFLITHVVRIVCRVLSMLFLCSRRGLSVAQARSALRTAADFLRRLQREAKEEGEGGVSVSAFALLQSRAF